MTPAELWQYEHDTAAARGEFVMGLLHQAGFDEDNRLGLEAGVPAYMGLADEI